MDTFHFLSFWLTFFQADEEVTNDLNIGSTDIDMTNMKTTVGSGNSRRSGQPMDMNMYATRKTIAQGIMDLGLMCANASQLKCKCCFFEH